jgi:hypothetical protein
MLRQRERVKERKKESKKEREREKERKKERKKVKKKRERERERERKKNMLNHSHVFFDLHELFALGRRLSSGIPFIFVVDNNHLKKLNRF